MALTDIKVKNAKASAKTTRISDEKGLYLEVSPKGGNWWRVKYHFNRNANYTSWRDAVKRVPGTNWFDPEGICQPPCLGLCIPQRCD
jgi:hypothetical protein